MGSVSDMKYFVTGSRGQLGKEILERLSKRKEDFLGFDKEELDITDEEKVIKFFKENRPKYVVNTAAFTAVDDAEEKQDICFKINQDGARNIAKGCDLVNAHFIQISTDYVFAGDGKTPLKEDDEKNPSNVYGKSKLEGEKDILNILGDNATILRTASLHGQYGNNFVKTMITLFTKKDSLNVVDDQIMSPTWAGFLADVILESFDKNVLGVFHTSNKGGISWYEFTRKILSLMLEYDENFSKVIINPCTSDEFPRPAQRPKYSVFNVSKLENALGHEIMSWEDGLKGHLKDLEYIRS